MIIKNIEENIILKLSILIVDYNEKSFISLLNTFTKNTKNNITLLNFAIENGNIDAFKLLIKHKPLRYYKLLKMTQILENIINNNNLELLKICLNHKCYFCVLTLLNIILDKEDISMALLLILCCNYNIEYFNIYSKEIQEYIKKCIIYRKNLINYSKENKLYIKHKLEIVLPNVIANIVRSKKIKQFKHQSLA